MVIVHNPVWRDYSSPYIEPTMYRNWKLKKKMLIDSNGVRPALLNGACGFQSSRRFKMLSVFSTNLDYFNHILSETKLRVMQVLV